MRSSVKRIEAKRTVGRTILTAGVLSAAMICPPLWAQLEAEPGADAAVQTPPIANPAAPEAPEAPEAPPAVAPGGTPVAPGAPVAAEEAPRQDLRVTIAGVQGMVQVRGEENAAWESAKAGMVLGPGAEFRTGPRSMVQFRVPPDQIITLDRLGTVKVLEAIRLAENKVKLDLGMEYGRTDYRVEAAGVEHDTTIRSPASTLAVRGTTGMTSSSNGGTFPDQFKAFNNLVTRTQGGQQVAFGGKGTQTQVNSNNGTPQDGSSEQANPVMPTVPGTPQDVQNAMANLTRTGQAFGSVFSSQSALQGGANVIDQQTRMSVNPSDDDQTDVDFGDIGFDQDWVIDQIYTSELTAQVYLYSDGPIDGDRVWAATASTWQTLYVDPVVTLGSAENPRAYTLNMLQNTYASESFLWDGLYLINESGAGNTAAVRIEIPGQESRTYQAHTNSVGELRALFIIEQAQEVGQ
ncbi:MAG: hypothetical protein WD042_00345 [Phycisphaeraceae bacterium]